jgi:hypothetical protein
MTHTTVITVFSRAINLQTKITFYISQLKPDICFSLLGFVNLTSHLC